MASAFARLFALARSKLIPGAGDRASSEATTEELADAYWRAACKNPADAELLETAVRLTLKSGRVDDARERLGERGQALGLRIVADAVIDPERWQRDERAYVGVVNDVLVETHDWAILDGDKIYNAEAHLRNVTKSPWVKNRTNPERNHYLYKLPAPAVSIGEPCIHLGGDANYAHWIQRNLLKLALIDGTPYEALPLLVNDDLTSYQREYLEMLGIPDSRLLKVPRDALIQCRQLVVPTTLVYSPRLSIGVTWLRRKLAGWMDPGPPRNLLYLSRADARWRRMTNEAELEEALRKLGFSIEVPGRMSVKEQIRAVSGARVIVAPHGAALTNLVFASPGATVLEINTVAKSHMKDITVLAATAGLNHEILLTVDYDPPQAGKVKRESDFRVDTAEVVRTLKALEPQLFG